MGAFTDALQKRIKQRTLANRIASDPVAKAFHAELIDASKNRYTSLAHSRLSHAQLLAGYGRFPYLRAVVDKISDSAGVIEWSLITNRNNRVESHPLLTAMNAGNQMFPGYMLRKLTFLYILLVGEAFWYKERNRLGAPIAFWPIPPHWVTALPHENDGNYKIEIYGFAHDVAKSEIVHFKQPELVNPYGRGTGKAEALADELETDEYASKHLKMFFKNNARPDLIIYSEDEENPITKDDAERMEQSWLDKLRGVWRAHKPIFLPSKVGIKELQGSLKDMQMLDLRSWQRNIVLNVYGVPPEALGILENSNRATIESAEFFLAKHVVLPLLQLMRSTLTAQILPEFNNNFTLGFKSPVEEDKVHQLRVMRTAPYAFRVDELRAAGEKEPLPNGEGEVFFIPNVGFVSSLSDVTGVDLRSNNSNDAGNGNADNEAQANG